MSLDVAGMEYCRIYFNRLTEDEQPDAVISMNTQEGQSVESMDKLSREGMQALLDEYRNEGWQLINFSFIEGHKVYTFRRAS